MTRYDMTCYSVHICSYTILRYLIPYRATMRAVLSR